jgi:hypothetical protein
MPKLTIENSETATHMTDSTRRILFKPAFIDSTPQLVSLRVLVQAIADTLPFLLQIQRPMRRTNATHRLCQRFGRNKDSLYELDVAPRSTRFPIPTRSVPAADP